MYLKLVLIILIFEEICSHSMKKHGAKSIKRHDLHNVKRHSLHSKKKHGLHSIKRHGVLRDEKNGKLFLIYLNVQHEPCVLRA